MRRVIIAVVGVVLAGIGRPDADARESPTLIARRLVRCQQASTERAAEPSVHRSTADLILLVEAGAQEDNQSERVFTLVTHPAWVQDLPLCFPGRDCVQASPGGAQAMYLIADLTPVSPGIAAVLWAGLGVSLLVIINGLRQHWRGSTLRPWLVLLALALIVVGAVLAWLMRAWLGEATLAYDGADGRPPAPTPSSVIASWPLVQSGAYVGIALGAIALFLMLNTAATRQRRAARANRAGLG